jgi:hypothetical protein
MVGEGELGDHEQTVLSTEGTAAVIHIPDFIAVTTSHV